MIEVIKYGKQFATCPNCHAVLRFDQEDIKTETIKYNEEEKYIKCPVCNNLIYENNFGKEQKFR